MGRSIGAVFAGIAANFVIAIVLDIVMHTLGVFQMDTRMTDQQCGIAFSYRLLAAFAGGYLCARLAPRKPLQHALVLGGIGIVLSTIGLITMKDVGPIWFPAALVVISLPASWAGAKIYLRD